jgi:hypothetical protein
MHYSHQVLPSLYLFYHIFLGKTPFVTPSAPVHELPFGVLHESNQLNTARQGIIGMEVDVRLPLHYARKQMKVLMNNNCEL